MTEETNIQETVNEKIEEKQPEVTHRVVLQQPKAPVFGIISTVLGAGSLIPFLGIISPFGLIIGIIGLFKDERNTVAIIGTCLSILGIITSPIVWALLAPPRKGASPAELGSYWGTVTFIALIILGFGVIFAKKHLEKKKNQNKD